MRRDERTRQLNNARWVAHDIACNVRHLAALFNPEEPVVIPSPENTALTIAYERLGKLLERRE